MDQHDARDPFKLSSRDIVALTIVAVGVVVITVLLVWILF
jgi:hypothetical protein